MKICEDRCTRCQQMQVFTAWYVNGQLADTAGGMLFDPPECWVCDDCLGGDAHEQSAIAREKMGSRSE